MPGTTRLDKFEAAALVLPAVQEEALNAEHRPAAKDETRDYLVIVELARNSNRKSDQPPARFPHLVCARPNRLIKRVVRPQKQARDGPGFDADIYCVRDFDLWPDSTRKS